MSVDVQCFDGAVIHRRLDEGDAVSVDGGQWWVVDPLEIGVATSPRWYSRLPTRHAEVYGATRVNPTIAHSNTIEGANGRALISRLLTAALWSRWAGY